MTFTRSYLPRVLWLVGAVILVLALILITQNMVSKRAPVMEPTVLGGANAAPATPSQAAMGYPAPATVSPSTPSPDGTAIASSDDKATASAVPPVAATTGRIIGPQTITDPAGHYSLGLRAGWWASLGATTVLVNYDEDTIANVNKFAPGDLKVQISVGRVQAGQSFDQWLSDWIAIETAPAPGSGKPNLAATMPVPFKLGNYDGFQFTIDSEYPITEVDLPIDDGWVIIIGFTPSDSPAMSEALSMLTGIEILQIPSGTGDRPKGRFTKPRQ